MKKGFKQILIVLAIIVMSFIIYKLVIAGSNDQEWNRTAIENAQYGQLKPLTWHSFGAVAADSAHKHTSVDSVQHSRSWKDTRQAVYGLILYNSYKPYGTADTEHVVYKLEGAPYDSTATWTTINTIRTVTRVDSLVAYTDTVILTNPRYNYYRFTFTSTRPSVSTNCGVIWYPTLITQPTDFWTRYSVGRDTSQIISFPDQFNYWTVWYKATNIDSIHNHIRALVSYDGTFWVKADSVGNGVTDSLFGFKALTLPRANLLKFEIDFDTTAGNTDYDSAGDSTGLYGVRHRLWYSQGR